MKKHAKKTLGENWCIIGDVNGKKECVKVYSKTLNGAIKQAYQLRPGIDVKHTYCFQKVRYSRAESTKII